MKLCNHCKLEFDTENLPRNWMANHVRWCKANPIRESYSESLKKARQIFSEDKDAIKKRNEKIKDAWASGKYDSVDFAASQIGRKHSVDTKLAIKKGALESDHRRLKKSTVVYKGVVLDSSWEVALAKRLDELQISWIRPAPLVWIDEVGESHNYFPDFFLPDYDLYLDPKNPHAMKVQSNKIKILNDTYSNIIWLTSLADCTSFLI